MAALSHLFLDLFLLCLCISLFIVLSKLKSGPSLADRAVAFELFVLILLSSIAYLSVFTGDTLYFDVGIVVALISFVGIIIIARFIEGENT